MILLLTTILSVGHYLIRPHQRDPICAVTCIAACSAYFDVPPLISTGVEYIINAYTPVANTTVYSCHRILVVYTVCFGLVHQSYMHASAFRWPLPAATTHVDDELVTEPNINSPSVLNNTYIINNNTVCVLFTRVFLFLFFCFCFMCTSKTIKPHSPKPRRSKNKTAWYIRAFEKNIALTNSVKHFFFLSDRKSSELCREWLPGRELLRGRIEPHNIIAILRLGSFIFFLSPFRRRKLFL